MERIVIISIHQPEHFPYEGFFQKMKKTDLFVILDNVKYRKNYFQNRNRFPDKKNKDQWFTIPVESSANSKLIKDVSVSKDPNWRKKIVKKILHNFNEDTTDIYSSDSLLEINLKSIKWCMDRLELRTPIVLASKLGVSGQNSSLLLDICKKTKAKKYISGPSGKDYLDLSLFENIEVEFFQPKVKNYYSMLYNIRKGEINV